MTDDSEQGISARLSAAAWIYFIPKNKELAEIIANLSLTDKSSSIAIAPLLMDLLVEQDFNTTVKIPISSYGGIVITKITSYYPVCMIFHGTEDILLFTEDHGDLQKVCFEARKRFNIQQFKPNTMRCETDLRALCTAVNMIYEDVLCHVAFTNGAKELLFSGALIPCVEEQVAIQIGNIDCVKVPLYPVTLFENDDSIEINIDSCGKFANENGFYSTALSETMFYYIFTAWGMSLRFHDTQELINAGLKQFLQDTVQSVKLAPHKRYTGMVNQKLTTVERDFLMLTDAAITELGFSYASEYWDSAYEPSQAMYFTEWPIIKSAETHEQKIQKLKELKLHISSHVAANVFANNSVWYSTKLAYVPTTKPTGNNTITQETLLKAIYFCNGLSSLNEDYYIDSKKLVKINTVQNKEDKYSVYHLAIACATNVQLLSDVVWNLNRVTIYNSGSGCTDMYNYIVNCSSNMCEFCNGTACQSCIGTALIRVANRLPSIPKQVKKEPVVLTMFSRIYADVDILGSFGKKHISEHKEGIKDGQSSTPTLDRMKFLNNIFDYCKKNSWIDSTTGEDIMSFRNKKDFVNMMTGLTQIIEDSVAKLISEMRKTQTSKEQIESSIQSFNVETAPYAMIFSPLLTYGYYRSMLFILQNTALIVATSHVVDRPCTGSSIAKWLSQQYQTLYGSFNGSHMKKGFMNMKTVKVQSNVEMEQIVDFQAYKQGTYVKTSTQAKLCKLSVQSFRDVRIKNRPINVSRKTSHTNVYFKKGARQKKNPVNGCLSFILFKCHDKLFPGNNISCLELWQKVLSNSLPRSVDIGPLDEFDSFLKCVLSITDDYDRCDVVDTQPESLVSFIECMFHNKFLTAIGYNEFISTLHGLTSTIVNQSYQHFPVLLKRKA